MQSKEIAALIATALQWRPSSLSPPMTSLIAKLELEGKPEVWVSVYGNTLDFAYLDQDPPYIYAQRIFASLPSWQLVDWSPGRLATIEFGPVELQRLSEAIRGYQPPIRSNE